MVNESIIDFIVLKSLADILKETLAPDTRTIWNKFLETLSTYIPQTTAKEIKKKLSPRDVYEKILSLVRRTCFRITRVRYVGRGVSTELFWFIHKDFPDELKMHALKALSMFPFGEDIPIDQQMYLHMVSNTFCMKLFLEGMLPYKYTYTLLVDGVDDKVQVPINITVEKLVMRGKYSVNITDAYVFLRDKELKKYLVVARAVVKHDSYTHKLYIPFNVDRFKLDNVRGECVHEFEYFYGDFFILLERIFHPDVWGVLRGILLDDVMEFDHRRDSPMSEVGPFIGFAHRLEILSILHSLYSDVMFVPSRVRYRKIDKWWEGWEHFMYVTVLPHEECEELKKWLKILRCISYTNEYIYAGDIINTLWKYLFNLHHMGIGSLGAYVLSKLLEFC